MAICFFFFLPNHNLSKRHSVRTESKNGIQSVIDDQKSSNMIRMIAVCWDITSRYNWLHMLTFKMPQLLLSYFISHFYRQWKRFKYTAQQNDDCVKWERWKKDKHTHTSYRNHNWHELKWIECTLKTYLPIVFALIISVDRHFFFLNVLLLMCRYR